ncbi:MAG: hypothetical protein V4722_05025 [Bacteroidota bacterium]
MARKYLIPFLSFLITAMLAYALQAHAPSWRDFINWFSWVALLIGGLELIAGLIFLVARKKIWAKELLLTAISLLIIGGTVSIMMAQAWTAPIK